MRLSEALQVLRSAPAGSAPAFRTFLACGFTPLHLKTFLAAHLRVALQGRPVDVETGLYGDLPGNIARLGRDRFDCGVIIVEWSDLDPRLGLRSLAGWTHAALPDITTQVGKQLGRLYESVAALSDAFPVAISLPTLPLPPIQYTEPCDAGAWDLGIRELLGSFARRVAGETAVKLVSAAWLDRISPAADRMDVKSELLDGFPYRIGHASALAKAVARLTLPPVPKKGIITDLDNTLWKGIAGEVGPEHVSWDLDRKSHTHALYQSLLCSLAETGILIGVASKNDPVLVEQAFDRKDLILARDRIFPFEVNWGPKSTSIDKILTAWNIAQESVVFLDDSPIELAEVQAAHPNLECLLFPSDPNDLYRLLERLRELFAKPSITEEDGIRLAGIRASAIQRPNSTEPSSTPEDFLEQTEGVMTLSFDKAPWDPRVLDLVNKTNQFNLNGRRQTEADLRSSLASSDALLMKVSYRDKYGPLGKISVLIGAIDGATLHVDSWVLSCRAFSRRIEHGCLTELFMRFPVAAIEFDFSPTERNKPLQEFFAGFLGEAPQAPFRLSRELFFAKSPRVLHQIEDNVHA